MPNPTLAQLAEDLAAGATSSRKLVEECLASQPPFPAVALQLQRMTKRRLCEGALRARSAAEACDEGPACLHSCRQGNGD